MYVHLRGFHGVAWCVPGRVRICPSVGEHGSSAQSLQQEAASGTPASAPIRHAHLNDGERCLNPDHKCAIAASWNNPTHGQHSTRHTRLTKYELRLDVVPITLHCPHAVTLRHTATVKEPSSGPKCHIKLRVSMIRTIDTLPVSKAQASSYCMEMLLIVALHK